MLARTRFLTGVISWFFLLALFPLIGFWPWFLSCSCPPVSRSRCFVPGPWSLVLAPWVLLTLGPCRCLSLSFRVTWRIRVDIVMSARKPRLALFVTGLRPSADTRRSGVLAWDVVRAALHLVFAFQ